MISPTLAVRAGGLFQDAGVAGRDYIKDDRDGAFITSKWTPTRHREAKRDLHPHQFARLAGLRRALLPAEHVHHRGRSVPEFRCQPQQFLRFRLPRFLSHRAGHRDHQCRSQHHTRPDPEQQDQDPAIGARLHRHPAGSTGDQEPAHRVDLECQSAEPLSDHQQFREPDRSDLQVRYGRLEAYRTGRTRGLAGAGEHR